MGGVIKSLDISGTTTVRGLLVTNRTTDSIIPVAVQINGTSGYRAFPMIQTKVIYIQCLTLMDGAFIPAASLDLSAKLFYIDNI